MSEKEVELLRKMIIRSFELLRELRKLRDQIRLECNKDSELKRFHDRICGMDDISLN
jgi:hypothetical protein